MSPPELLVHRRGRMSQPAIPALQALPAGCTVWAEQGRGSACRMASARAASRLVLSGISLPQPLRLAGTTSLRCAASSGPADPPPCPTAAALPFAPSPCSSAPLLVVLGPGRG